MLGTIKEDALEFEQEVQQRYNKEDVVVFGCVAIYNTKSPRPTEAEMALTRLLLSQCSPGSSSYKELVVHTLSVAAIKWRDVELWAKTFRFGYSDINSTVGHSVFRLDRIILAVRMLGFESVKPMLSESMTETHLMHKMYGLFEQMLQAAGEVDTAEAFPQHVVDWITQSQQELLKAIGGKATDSYDKLIHKCLVQGGVSYIQEHVLPICADASTVTFLRELAVRLHRHEAVVESPAKRAVIAELLKVVLSKATVALPEPSFEAYYPPDSDTPCDAETMLAACIDASCNEVAEIIVKTLVNNLTPTRDRDIAIRILTLLLSLKTHLDKCSPLPGYIAQLQTKAHKLYISEIIKLGSHMGGYGLGGTLRLLNSSLTIPGGIESFLLILGSKLDEITAQDLGHLSNAVADCAIEISQTKDTLGRTDTNMTAVTLAIRQYTEFFDGNSVEVDKIEAGLLPFLDRRLRDASHFIVNTMLQQLCNCPTHLDVTLKADGTGRNISLVKYKEDTMGLLDAVLGHMKMQKLSFPNTVGPRLCTFIQSWIQTDLEDPTVVITTTFEDDLGTLATLRCSRRGCLECKHVQHFLTVDQVHAVLRFKKMAPDDFLHVTRSLLEPYVSSEIATWSVESKPTGQSRNQHELEIVKSHQLFRPSASADCKKRVQRMLDMVDPDEVKRAAILGPGYKQIHLWREGKHEPHAKQASSSRKRAAAPSVEVVVDLPAKRHKLPEVEPRKSKLVLRHASVLMPPAPRRPGLSNIILSD